MRRSFALAGSIAALFLATFIGLSITGQTEAIAAPAARTGEITVIMGDYWFDPAEIVLQANQPIQFVLPNVGVERHRLNFAAFGERWRLEDPAPGESRTSEAFFELPGVYEMWCNLSTPDGVLHSDLGMVGTLTVVGEPVVTTTITLSEFRIDPASTTVLAGQTTRFDLHNAGELSHNLVITGQGAEWSSPTVRVGEPITWDVVFERPGTYEAYCSFTRPESHKDLGMVGTIEVLRGS